MNLLIADDNERFRTRLAAILGEIPGVRIVAEAGDVPGAIEAIGRTDPDTVILDVQMPGGNGLDVLEAVKSRIPSPMVIMLTVGPRSQYQSRSFLMGADYFFEKSSELTRLAALLRQVARPSGADAKGRRHK
jgi:DNA-binding NarL/FixJ family response regulator